LTRHTWLRLADKSDIAVLQCANCKRYTAVSLDDPYAADEIARVRADHSPCAIPRLGDDWPHDENHPHAVVVFLNLIDRVYRTRLPDGTEKEHRW